MSSKQCIKVSRPKAHKLYSSSLDAYVRQESLVYKYDKMIATCEDKIAMFQQRMALLHQERAAAIKTANMFKTQYRVDIALDEAELAE